MSHVRRGCGWGRPNYWRDPTFAAVYSGTIYGDRTDIDARPNLRPIERVYFVRAIGHGIKLGYTRNLPARMTSMQTDCPHDLVLIGTLSGGSALERCLKEDFVEHRLRGEWYDERILPMVLDLLKNDEGFYEAAA
jgi:hypothetical protein